MATNFSKSVRDPNHRHRRGSTDTESSESSNQGKYWKTTPEHIIFTWIKPKINRKSWEKARKGENLPIEEQN